jgi:sugar lactone lactonase YvrE
MAVRTIVEGYTYFEGPRWHNGRLYVSDFYTQQVISVGPAGSVRAEAEVPGQPSGTGWLPDGRMLVVSMRDRLLLRREASGEMAVHADLSRLAPWHLNDMVVDGAGRAYVGDFGFDLMAGAEIRTTGLIRVEPDGTAEVVADGLYFPNGSVLTPDGRTLLVAETFGQRISAFDVGTDGALSVRRDWARFGPLPDTTDAAEAAGSGGLAPDGMCLDAEGLLWIADAVGNRVVRVREGGEVADEISTGDLGVYACMLGGEDGRTLYMCAAPSFAEEERRTTREGRLLATEVAVPHAGLP